MRRFFMRIPENGRRKKRELCPLYAFASAARTEVTGGINDQTPFTGKSLDAGNARTEG
jgi:hypothetical protein